MARHRTGGLPGTAPSPEPAFAPPDCLVCGACCFSAAEHYVRVSGADWSRLGAEAEHWATFHDHRAYLRMVDGHCAALRIEAADPTRGRPGRFICLIYERRPQVCRDLDRGAPACEAEWLRKHAEAQRAAAGNRAPELHASD